MDKISCATDYYRNTAATLQSFKKHLKTFLLQRPYSLAL